MALTQNDINTYVAYFACKINTLSTKYKDSLEIGSPCADTYLFQLQVVITLNEILCSINIDEEGCCLTEDNICKLIEKIKYVLNKTYTC